MQSCRIALQSHGTASGVQRSSQSDAGRGTASGHELLALNDAGEKESPPRHHTLQSGPVPAVVHHSPDQQSTPRRAAAPARHLPPANHGDVPPSAENLSGYPAHPPGHGSWCSVRPGCVQSLDPPFSSTVLVGANNRGIKHRVFMVCISTQDFKHPLPNAFLGPAAKAGVDHPKVPKALRQVAPGDACTIAVKYRLNEQAVVACSDANGACPSRQMVFDAIPLVIAKGIALVHPCRMKTSAHHLKLFDDRP